MTEIGMFTGCDLHIPHKEWSGDEHEHQNYLEIERWSQRLKDCFGGGAAECLITVHRMAFTGPVNVPTGTTPTPVSFEGLAVNDMLGTALDPTPGDASIDPGLVHTVTGQASWTGYVSFGATATQVKVQTHDSGLTVPTSDYQAGPADIPMGGGAWVQANDRFIIQLSQNSGATIVATVNLEYTLIEYTCISVDPTTVIVRDGVPSAITFGFPSTGEEPFLFSQSASASPPPDTPITCITGVTYTPYGSIGSGPVQWWHVPPISDAFITLNFWFAECNTSPPTSNDPVTRRLHVKFIVDSTSAVPIDITRDYTGTKGLTTATLTHGPFTISQPFTIYAYCQWNSITYTSSNVNLVGGPVGPLWPTNPPGTPNYGIQVLGHLL